MENKSNQSFDNNNAQFAWDFTVLFFGHVLHKLDLKTVARKYVVINGVKYELVEVKS